MTSIALLAVVHPSSGSFLLGLGGLGGLGGHGFGGRTVAVVIIVALMGIRTYFRLRGGGRGRGPRGGGPWR